MLVHERIWPVVKRFVERRVVTAEDLPKFYAAINSAMRMRNSAIVEVALLVFVYTVGIWTWRHNNALEVASWYASPQELPEFLHSDLQIRNYVKKKLQYAAVSKIVIERAWNSIRVTIFTARPGIVIGRKGAEIEKMTEEISKMAQGKQVKIDIQEINLLLRLDFSAVLRKRGRSSDIGDALEHLDTVASIERGGRLAHQSFAGIPSLA